MTQKHNRCLKQTISLPFCVCCRPPPTPSKKRVNCGTTNKLRDRRTLGAGTSFLVTKVNAIRTSNTRTQIFQIHWYENILFSDSPICKALGRSTIPPNKKKSHWVFCCHSFTTNTFLCYRAGQHRRGQKLEIQSRDSRITHFPFKGIRLAVPAPDC